MILSYFLIALFIVACIVGGIAVNEYLKSNFGNDYAKQNIIFFVLILLFILFFSSIIIIFGNRNNISAYISIFFFIFIFFTVILKISNREKKGKILHIFEIDEASKSIYYLGILQFIVQPFSIYSGISYFLDGNQLNFISFLNKFGIPISGIIFGIYAFFYLRFPIKLYENGISISDNFISWNKITEYKFLSKTQRTFQFQYDNPIPFFPKSMGFVISKKDQESLLEILQQKLPHLGEQSAS